MRQCGLGLLVLVSGCLPHKALQPPGAFQQARFYDPNADYSQAHLEVALLRRPAGERYLNEDLWREIDEQRVPLEQKPVLRANGLRVGALGGTIPAELRETILSEQQCKMRRLALQPGREFVIKLGPGDRPLAIQVLKDGETMAMDLHNAQCALAIEATLTEDGRTRIRFEPRIAHGKDRLQVRPSADRTDWEVMPGRPLEKYPHLACEISLAANEYAVVGGLAQRPGSVGHACLVNLAEEPPEQYLLVIRAPGRPSGLPPTAGGADTHSSPYAPAPLAWQTIAAPRPPVGTQVRGQSPERRAKTP